MNMVSVQNRLHEAGLKQIHQGKVRDTYALSDEGFLLMVATDRMSIYDFAIPTPVPQKGEILTALTVFWLTEILRMMHHLVAFGRGIDLYLPPALKKYAELQKRALVVEKLEMLPVECIVRGYLTGSGWQSYQKNREVCGFLLPEGLHDGALITPKPIFTPTTKAQAGHDEPLATREVVQQYGTPVCDISMQAYQTMAKVAETKGLIMADTKVELGRDKHGNLVVADEVGTPDSSRFWDHREWKTALKRKESPSPIDKQLVRDWGKTLGIHLRNPQNEQDLKYVQERCSLPPKVVEETSRRYHEVLRRLTGKTLVVFQEDCLGVV
jgi:phosphoribosylaminoimidazole-succinocarboxamide synthase